MTVFAFALLATAAAQPAAAVPPGMNGDLLVERDNTSSGTDHDVYRLNPSTGAETLALNGPNYQGEAAFDFGHTQILHTTFNGGPPRIFVSGPNGENPTQVPTGGDPAFSPQFTGADSEIVYGHASGDLYIQNLDGTGMRNVTPGTPDSGEFNPVVSPQGNWIAFQSLNQNTFRSDIGTVNPNGTGFNLITDGNATDEGQPEVSPNAQWIYYTQFGADANIQKVRPDGSDVMDVVTGTGDQTNPHPSADSTKLAYTSNHIDADGDGSTTGADREVFVRQLIVIPRRGSTDTRLTTNAVADFVTDWGALAAGPPPPPADSTSPDVDLSGKKKQKLGKKVKVKVSCDELCTATGSGKLVVPKTKGSSKAAARLKKAAKFKLKKQTKQLRAGETRNLKLKIPGKGRKAAKQALKQGTKKPVKAKIKVTAVDAAGNRSKAKQTIKLKR